AISISIDVRQIAGMIAAIGVIAVLVAARCVMAAGRLEIALADALFMNMESMRAFRQVAEIRRDQKPMLQLAEVNGDSVIAILGGDSDTELIVILCDSDASHGNGPHGCKGKSSGKDMHDDLPVWWVAGHSFRCAPPMALTIAAGRCSHC